jgi:hypothetical protein
VTSPKTDIEAFNAGWVALTENLSVTPATTTTVAG